MVKASYKERAKYRREQEILKTAARMIRDKGYVNLNMDDLAEEVGISKPTLYQHFKGKDDMVAKAMRRAMEDMEAYITQVEGTSAFDKLMNIMRYMLETHAKPDGFSVAIMRDGGFALSQLTDDHSRSLDIQVRVGRCLAEMIHQAKVDGDIRQDLPDLVVMGAMFSSMYILQSPSIVRDYSNDIEQIIEGVLSFFKHGVCHN